MPVVLIIDDEPAMRRTLRRILESSGHTVLEAPDGRKGLKLFNDHRPALVIADILMPEKEGLETIRELRAQTPDAKIIAISGGGSFGEPGFLHAASVFGAGEILQKPFRAEELMAAVTRMLDGGRDP